ncbi:phage antirepressor KilAC domain-containing protein [Ligilactobacillus salivarius]|uniref:Phage antirepressor KilAC domain-containing protein n=1 Tax=Ligilactobacillus salivarius TaxID=1624 RepID=A0AAX3X657_9LACO|nr:phage antirepressor KilAC domain-containing protein [Ligilactobacillus salivarius]WII29153.1 phage antirepressor KilAC domain-containing protein [Ligilactobacillus salivarius]
MEELIKVTTKGDTQVVSARELYKGLEIKRRFSAWVSDNFKDFIEDVDFTSVRKSTEVKNNGGIQIRELQDYAITISMAKELCMMSHTELGKEYRKYFLELERKWNDPKEVVKRGYAILQNENKQLKIENGILKPKADKYDRYLSNKGLITITEIAKEYGMSGRELNKFLHDKRIIFKKGDKWFVYQRYANDGLVGYEIYMPEDREIRRTLKWTTKGEQFIRNILEDEGIKPVLERPSQMMIEEPQEEYDGDYYTASEIAYKLYLPKGAELLIGKLANEYRLKPVFSDSNKYCRRVVDEYGRETWQYTALGARVIEELIEKMEV